MRAYVAVGSNVAPLRHVFSGLRRLNEACPVAALSPFWWTKPLARPAQDPFLNGVAAVVAEGPPEDLVAVLRGIEAAEARVRTPDRHAPRTLDLDLILMADLVRPELGLPDPAIRSRRFLAAGLLAIDPDVVVPDGKGPLQDPGGMALREEPLVTMAAVEPLKSPSAVRGDDGQGP